MSCFGSDRRGQRGQGMAWRASELVEGMSESEE